MANIIVLGAQVPFSSGGQEVLVSSLVREIRARGHACDTVQLPFNVPTHSHLLHQTALWRSLDFSEFAGKTVDLVIGTKFPSYFARHPRKSLWLVHQHRPIYDLYGGPYSDFSDSPEDEAIRRMLVEGDTKAIGECAFVAGISKNVTRRLVHYNGIKAATLYPPLPLGNRYKRREAQPYILSVGRICGIKRVDMMIKSMPMIHNFVKLKVVGQPDEPGVMDYLQNEIAKHHLSDRVEFLGRVSDETLIDLYADALAVYYAPYNEDYGYVTLEAFASGKPVVTGTDSGGVLEFVKDSENGLIAEPTLDAISRAFNRLIEDVPFREALGNAALRELEELGYMKSTWDSLTAALLAPIASAQSHSN